MNETRLTPAEPNRRRYVVLGAGAVGCNVGARLSEIGGEVVLVARGDHAAALRTQGLVLQTPHGTRTYRLPTVSEISDAAPGGDDVVLLATKGQDTEQALRALSAVASCDLPVVCLQNGIDNERQAARRFRRVYAAMVIMPAFFAEPGIVQNYSGGANGIIDMGRYPGSVDPLVETLVADLNAAGFSSEARADIMRWKAYKLVDNLRTVLTAMCGWHSDNAAIIEAATLEAQAVLSAAGIAFASDEEANARRGDLVFREPIDGRTLPGTSAWQALHRRTGTSESDWLNGEITCLGQLVGHPTPVNLALQQLASEAARACLPPESGSHDAIWARIASFADETGVDIDARSAPQCLASQSAQEPRPPTASKKFSV